MAFSGLQTLSEAEEKNGQTEETEHLSAKGKRKMFPTYRSQGEWRALRKPKSFLLFIYMYEYFVVSSGRKQFSNCTRRLILQNRCSLILFNREIILFNYNPICKQRILGNLGAEIESGSCDVCIFSIQAHRLWNLCEKAFFSCKWHRKKKKKRFLCSHPQSEGLQESILWLIWTQLTQLKWILEMTLNINCIPVASI